MQKGIFFENSAEMLIMAENGIWKLLAEHLQTETWMLPVDRLFNRLSSTHISQANNKIVFYPYAMTALG